MDWVWDRLREQTKEWAMAIEIEMPRLSDTMESGTLVKWYVNEGDAVEADQVLADIETDKATMEMPTYDAGVLARILVQPGDSVDVGGVLCVLAEEGESAEEVAAKYASGASSNSSDASAGSKSAEEGSASTTSTSSTATMDPPSSSSETNAAAAAAPAPAPSGGSGDSGNGGRMAISPLARRLAEERGIDLSQVKGSGPGGRIVKRDILNAPAGTAGGNAVPSAPSATPTHTPSGAAVPTNRPTLGGTVPLSNMRQTIARRLVESKTTIPHYQVSMNIDMDPLLELRRTLNEQLNSQGVKLSVNDFLVRACALSIYDHPMFNAVWNQSELKINEQINVGVAVSLPDEKGGGLVVATLYDADRKGLRQLSAETKMLAGKARDRGLSIEEMSNSTFTISNLGMFGVDFFTAIVNPPNSAILAVGGAQERPVVRNGEIVIGHEMSCTLSLDHRIIDGASAARFLQTLKGMMENPATLLV